MKIEKSFADTLLKNYQIKEYNQFVERPKRRNESKSKLATSKSCYDINTIRSLKKRYEMHKARLHEEE